MEQQSLEVGTIRERLNSLDGNETVLEYVREKARIKNEIRHLEVTGLSVVVSEITLHTNRRVSIPWNLKCHTIGMNLIGSAFCLIPGIFLPVLPVLQPHEPGQDIF